MRTRASTYLRFLVVFALIGGTGLAAGAYLLVQQRVSIPFRDTLTVNAEFTEAHGVVDGIGQPVNVAGVKVGQISGVELRGGRAAVTLELVRKHVPEVYENATASLEPITPLKDMQINLDPGGPPAEPLPGDAAIGIDRTNQPVELSELLSVLDADTRSFLASLLGSLDRGTRGRAPDLRAALRAMGPATAQVGRISRALAERRRELARLVHNLAAVARAASRDDRLADVVIAGNQTLEALAEQDAPLREAIEKLPSTLEITRSTLVNLGPFARKLGPTVTELLPALDRLPDTLASLRDFAEIGTPALRRDVRPLVRDVQPVVRQLGPTVQRLTAIAPHLSRSFQVLEYLTNELAYNPDGDNDGFLFWLSWFGHNWNSFLSLGDAHGGIGRGSFLVTCEGLEHQELLRTIFNLTNACPE